MKVTSIFLLSALVLFSFSGFIRLGADGNQADTLEKGCNTKVESLGREAQCDIKIKGCPKIYAPVCGTDGRTYTNECILCFENGKRQIPVRILKSGPC